MSRCIIVGDIHGCWEELKRLLEACGRRPEDEVVSVGDMVDRGPDPVEVVRFFMQDGNAAALLGNHEDKHVRVRAGELVPGAAQEITRHLMGDFYDEALDWFETLPLTLVRHGHFVAHAGVLPGTPLDRQPRSALLRAKMPWMTSIFDETSPRWWERYDGTTPVAYGHSVEADVLVRNNTWGIDTGACRGGKLSALVLPERQIVQVASACDYFAESQARHARVIEDLGRRHAEREVERRRDKARAKAPPRRPMVVQGVAVTGGWLLQHYGKDRGGPWVGELLASLREQVERGELATLDDVRRVLPQRSA
jgi:serine/threonine protein phosphatase 1